MGGSSQTFSFYAASHVEIIYDVTKYDAIYCSFDPNLSNSGISDNPDVPNDYPPILEAVFLQNEALKLTGVKLPIFVYSALHNYIVKLPDYTQEQLKAMWVDMCSRFLRLSENEDILYFQSLDTIKTLALYRTLEYKYSKSIGSADTNYSTTFQKEIDAAITAERQRLIAQRIKQISQELHNNELTLDSKSVIKTLFVAPDMRKEFRTQIQDELSKLQESTVFNHVLKTSEWNISFYDDYDSSTINLDLLKQSKLMRILKFSENLELEKERDIIYQKIFNLYLEILNVLKNNVDSRTNNLFISTFATLVNQPEIMGMSRSSFSEFDELKSMIRFANAFGIYKHLKNEIQVVSERYYLSYLKKMPDRLSGDQLLQLLSYIALLDSSALFTDQMKKETENFFETMSTQITNFDNFNESTLLKTLDIFSLFKLSPLTQTNLIIKLMDAYSPQEPLDIVSQFYEKLSQAGFLNDDNITAIIINKLTTRYPRPYFMLRGFFNNLEILRSLISVLPEQRLSSKNKQLVIDGLTTLYNDTLINDISMNRFESYVDFVKTMGDLLMQHQQVLPEMLPLIQEYFVNFITEQSFPRIVCERLQPLIQEIFQKFPFSVAQRDRVKQHIEDILEEPWDLSNVTEPPRP